MISKSAIAAFLTVGLCAPVSVAVAQHAVRTDAIQPQDPDITIRQRTDRRRIVDFAATPNSYVVVIRVGARGVVDVLYPLIPSVDKSLVKSGRTVHVDELSPSRAKGGAIYGFVSLTPYDFARVSSDNGWNTLHLANYSGSTDEVIAQRFGSEIAQATSRVVMARGTPGGPALVDRAYTYPSRLADFRNKPCPYLARPTTASVGSTDCLIYGMQLSGQGTPTQTSQPSTTPRGKNHK